LKVLEKEDYRSNSRGSIRKSVKEDREIQITNEKTDEKNKNDYPEEQTEIELKNFSENSPLAKNINPKKEFSVAQIEDKGSNGLTSKKENF
jgi:hypothetical protein